MDRRRFVGLAALVPMVCRSASIKAAPAKAASAGKPFVVLPESGRVYDTGHGETRILVGADQSGGGWWLGNFLSEPGRKTSLHVHFSAAEQVYVLSGILSIWLEKRWQDLPAGALAVAPARVPHALGNRSKEPVRFLVSGEPAGFEGFFADIEATARRFPYGSPEFLAELAKVYKKYDSEMLGPPPGG